MTPHELLDLPDLASETIGGAAILCNDEFFAEKENLLKPHEAEWKEHAYTDRGKWMDGWESRRRRTPGTVPARRRRDDDDAQNIARAARSHP